jgi:metallo-beta-lactamase class B
MFQTIKRIGKISTFLLLTIGITSRSFAQPALTISHLTGDFYVFTTYKTLAGGPYPSNGLYLVTNKGVVMIDCPWDSTQFQPLVDSIYLRHKKRVVLCIATHFHDDRTAALDFLRQHGVATYSSVLTYELSMQKHNPLAEHTFTQDTVFNVGNYSFSTFYPGEGHTRDNIVVWFPSDKILYGGCFVKSTEVNELGYTVDANVPEWPRSVQRLIDRYPNPAFIIPGHFGWSDLRSLQHTLDILKSGSSK